MDDAPCDLGETIPGEALAGGHGPVRSAVDLLEQARELRRAGLSTRQIAERMGIPCNGTLKSWLKGTPPPEWTRRPQAKDELRRQARELRAEGASIPDIALRLGVSKSTSSLWLRDMPSRGDGAQLKRRSRTSQRPPVTRRSRRIRRLLTKFEAGCEIGRMTNRELFLVGVGLYWSEGQKDKPWLNDRRERVVFVNSDPRMIQVFLAWLDLLGVPASDRRYRVSIHELADVAEAERFWSDLVDIPRAELHRSSLKRHNPLTTRRNVGHTYRGCLCVDVLRSAELYQRIEGWWFGIFLHATEQARTRPA